MKIHLYLRNFPAHGKKINSGLAKAVHGLAEGLVYQGEDVTILSEASKTENSSFSSPSGYKIKCFLQPIQSRPSFRLSPGLKEYVSQHLDSSDIVILNGILHPTIYTLSRLLRYHRVPYIVAPHDVYHPDMLRKNWHLKIPYWYLLEKQVLNQAKGIQVLSSEQAKWLRQRGIKTPIFEVTNGFSSDDVDPSQISTRSDGGSDEESMRILYFGRLDIYHKGLDLLLSAFSDIATSVNAELTFQGPNGSGHEQLRQKAKQLPIAKKIIFREPEYKRSSSLVFSDYDILCTPSRFEGFGLSALEAMIAERVLLVSEEAGIAPHVKASGCGVVVTPEVLSIRQGLLELYQNRSEWKSMGLNGRNYALKNLNWSEIAANAINNYQLVMK